MKSRSNHPAISLDNFDPTGPRDKPLDSPRSLKACELVGISPTALFVLDKKELAQQLSKENIPAKDKEAAYNQYIEEMKNIFDKLVQLRNEIIENERSDQPEVKAQQKSGKKKSGERQSRTQKQESQVGEKNDEGAAPNAEEDGDNDGGEPEAVAMASKIANRSRRPIRKSKNGRPSSAQPTKEMMEQFQQTQFLGQNRSNRMEASSRIEEDPIQKLQKVQEREQRRQLTMLQSYQNLEEKKQQLLKKIQKDSLIQKRHEVEKKIQREEKLERQMRKQMERNQKLQRNKYIEAYRAQEIENRRREKEEKARIKVLLDAQWKKSQILKQENEWDEKMDHVHNMKDVEEFRRGVAMAQLSQKEERFKIWLTEREELRKQKQMITQALEKQRQEIVDQFEHVRKEKERENQIIADSIKNGAIDLNAADYALKLPRGSTPHSVTSKQRRSAKKSTKRKGQEVEKIDEQELAKMIEQYNEQNEQEIARLLEEKEQAIQTLQAQAGVKGGPSQQDIDLNIEAVKKETQKRIDIIRKTQEKEIKKVLKSQGLELATN